MEKKNKEVVISKEISSRIKNLIAEAKKNNKIKPHTDAFLKYPVEFECHKGNANYFK